MTTDATRSSSSSDRARSTASGPTTAGDQVLRQALQAFACDAASIVRYSRTGQVELLVSSEASAQRADQLQLGLDEGAALSAREQGEVTLSGDVRTDRRWPRWGSAVAGIGWQSVLSAPLAVPEREVGVLTLYARRLAAFDATHAYAARIFAEHAATTLAQPEDTAHLREAIASRQQIGLAQGIVMEQHGLGPEQAFDLLSRTSRGRGAKLRRLAEEVVAAGGLDGDRTDVGGTGPAGTDRAEADTTAPPVTPPAGQP